MTTPDRPWRNTTHRWERDVDEQHLRQIRESPHVYGAGGVTHLVLEILAYASDEAEATGRRGHCLVQLRADGTVLVTDDGRGTDTRIDSFGRPVRKPVMATEDLRFFDAPDPPMLRDRLPRRGMSVVAALSPWLLHINRRRGDAWAQEYRYGRPSEALRRIPLDGTTGTTVHVLPGDAVGSVADVATVEIADAASDWLHVTVEDLR